MRDQYTCIFFEKYCAPGTRAMYQRMFEPYEVKPCVIAPVCPLSSKVSNEEYSAGRIRSEVWEAMCAEI